jgi:hypothetical protein
MERALDALQAIEIDRHYFLADRLGANNICAGSCPDPKPECTQCWEVNAVRHRLAFAKAQPRYDFLNLSKRDFMST